MKKYIFILALLPLLSCEEELPTEASFEDLYGRESWDTGSDVANEDKGKFVVDRIGDLSMTESTVDSSTIYTFEISGEDPFFSTDRALYEMPSSKKVMTFMYKSDVDIEPGISLDIFNPYAFTKTFPMEASADWKVFEFDLALLISKANWGRLGSSFRFYFGGKSVSTKELEMPIAGSSFQIKDIQVRERTPEEQEAANALFLYFDPISNQNRDISEESGDVSTIVHYAAHTIRYEPLIGAVDSHFGFMLFPRDIAEDENYISFEYKNEVESKNIQFFFMVKGGCNTKPVTLPPSPDEWTNYTIDISADKAKTIEIDPASVLMGSNPRFDINGDESGGHALYLRGFRIHN